MSDYTISIPDNLYEKAQRVAEQTAQSVDQVIRARLEGAFADPLVDIPANERAELRALGFLSDDTLWTIMQEQMQPVKQIRLTALMEKNSNGSITDGEYDELAALVEDGQRLTLRKAEAMRLLMDRGYSLTLDDMQSPHE